MKNKIDENICTKDEFLKNGYSIIKNFLSPQEVEDFKVMLVDGYNSTLEEDITLENISKIIVKYEKKNLHDELYEAFKHISSSHHFVQMGEKFSHYAKENFDLKTKLISTGYAIGIKDAKRTSYDWHQEKPYYEKNETIHLQFPMIYPCSKGNGTMSVLEGSHELGYIKEFTNVQHGKKSVYSYVPEDINNYVNIYPEKFINMSIRDAAIFDQNIIHRTNKSSVNEVRFAGIVRLQII